MPRILLIADVPNWVFASHCKKIKELLGKDFDFTIKLYGEPFNEDDYDLIYPLEYRLVKQKIKNPAKYVTGIRSLISWDNRNLLDVLDILTHQFQAIHVVSKELYTTFKQYLPNVSYVTHGVDTSYFTPTTKRATPATGQIVIGWAGNRNSSAKSFTQLVKPLDRIKGVKLIYCGFDTRNLSAKQMKKFYEKIDVYVCASSSEGNSNVVMEAASMGCAIVTTSTGTVPEYLADGKSALIVKHELIDIMQAVIKLRDNPRLRLRLGAAARKAVVSFDWSVKIEDYRSFFLKALRNRDSWKPVDLPITKELKPNYRFMNPERMVLNRKALLRRAKNDVATSIKRLLP